MNETDSTFLRHIPCPACSSRNNNSLYSDGHEYCYGCGYYKPGEGQAGEHKHSKGKLAADLILDGEFRALRSRKIDEGTCQKFGYRVGEDAAGNAIHIAPYYDADGRLVAQKVRGKDKKFSVRGDIKQALPFGAQLWGRGGKKLVVTEGEIDAMSFSQAQGNKWPVVSIGCGAGAQIRKYIAQHREYFRSFEEVILMFDMDDPGRKAAREAAEVIGMSAKIAELPAPYKDANDMLKAGKVDDLLRAMWNAQAYRPDGIVDMASLEEEVMKPVEIGLPWWSESLTRLTYGRRRGELYALGAGTGVGKTDFLTQQIAYDVKDLNLPVGVFFLEQGPVETAKRIAGKLAGKTFHIPDSGWTEADLRGTWAELQASGKVFLYDSFGMNDWDAIEEKIEFLAHSEGIKDFYFDHLTAVASGDGEREELERVMAKMGALVKRLDITLTFVSHLATPDGKPHEEGGRVTIRHFKGSRSIGFWSHYMFGLERDQQAEDERVRTTTTFRVLKDRYTGRATGEVFYLGYDRETGRLYETSDPTEDTDRHGFREEEPRADERSSDL